VPPGGLSGKPYAILMAPGVYDDVPLGVLCAWTPIVSQRVVVLPLVAASALLNESLHLVPEVAEGKAAVNE